MVTYLYGGVLHVCTRTRTYVTRALAGGTHDAKPLRDVYHLSKHGDSWLPASLGLYHGSLLSVSVHSSYLPVSLRDYICENSESESESTTFGNSMDRFDIRDVSSDSSSSDESSSRSHHRWHHHQAGLDSSSSRSSLSLNVFDNA